MKHNPIVFTRSKDVSPSEKLTEEVEMFQLLDKSLQEVRAVAADLKYQDKAKTLGAGRVGHSMAPVPYERGCERALYYTMRRYPADRPLYAPIYRCFAMDKAAKDIMAENLATAGFEIQRTDANGNRYGFAVGHDPQTGMPRFAGWADGVIVNGPLRIGKDGQDLRYPMLWKCKGLADAQFSRFLAEGMERSHGQYYAEVQVLMNFMNLYHNPTLFTALSRDTGDVRVEFVRFHRKHTQAALDRAARIIEAQGPLMLERASDKWEDLPCRNCEHAEQCKKDEANREAGPNPTSEPPAWLTEGEK